MDGINRRYNREIIQRVQASGKRLAEELRAAAISPVEAGDIIEVDGDRYTVSDVYDDGSVEIMERFVVPAGEYTVVERRGRG